MRVVTVAALLDARREAAEGRPGEALLRLVDLFAYGSDLVAGPGISSTSVGLTVMTRALEEMEARLAAAALPSPERRALAARFAEAVADIPADRRALLGEMATFSRTLRRAAHGDLVDGGGIPDREFLEGAADSWARYGRWIDLARGALDRPPGRERLEALDAVDEGPLRREDDPLHVRPPRLLPTAALLGSLRARAAGLLLALLRADDPSATLEAAAGGMALEGPLVRDLPPDALSLLPDGGVAVATFDREGKPLSATMRVPPAR